MKEETDHFFLQVEDTIDKGKRALELLEKMPVKFCHNFDIFSEVGSCLRSCGESLFSDWYQWGYQNYSPFCDGTLETKLKRTKEWERFDPSGDGTIRLSQIETYTHEKEITSKSAVFNKLQKMWCKRLRLNTMSKEVELDGAKLTPDYLYLDLLKYGICSSKDFVIDCVAQMAVANEYNPLTTYLDKCHQSHNDTSILDTISSEYFGTTNPIYDTMVKKALIAAVARAYKPGCKVDTTLILQGGQGVGKSTFFKILAGDFFDDGLGSNVTDQNEKMRLSAHWILEWGELERIFSQRDASSIKAFLTSTHDSYRRPWGKNIETYPRHCVIVGSTNRDDFLNDSTGSRRFWVVPVQGKVNLKKLKDNREPIWGAAVQCFLNKEAWFLSHQEEILRQELNKDYQKEEPWFEAISNYCYVRDRVTTSEILNNILKIELGKQDKQSQMRVTDVLRALGWVKRPSNGIKFWVSPEKNQEIGGTGGTDTTKTYINKGLEDSATPSATPVPPNNSVPPKNTSNHSVPPQNSEVALPSNQVPVCNTAMAVPPVPPKTSAKQFPHKGNAKPVDKIKLGDRVEVVKGFFAGATGTVEAKMGLKFYVVSPKWVVGNEFTLDQLRAL
jgi:predicted P-loop ATPase